MVGGIDNGRQKTRNHGYDVIVGGELFTDYSDHPRKTCHAKPKTQINRRRTLPAFLPAAGCLPQAVYQDSLPKVRTLHISRLRSGALPMIDRGGYPSGNRPLQQYLGFTVSAVMVSSSIRLTAHCKIQRSGRNGQRD